MVFRKMNFCIFNSMCQHTFIFAKFPLCLLFLSTLLWCQNIPSSQYRLTFRAVYFTVVSLDHLHHRDPRSLLLRYISGLHPTTPEAEFLEVGP